VFISNFAGLPGVFLAGKPGNRTKGQFKFGQTIAIIGQTYIYLAYTAFIVSWTKDRIDQYDIIKFLVWTFAFLAVMGPIWKDLIHARLEDRESKYANPQVQALHNTVVLVLIGFFIFVFIPSTMNSIWGWVPYVTK
jgi:hypothetical protein